MLSKSELVLEEKYCWKGCKHRAGKMDAIRSVVVLFWNLFIVLIYSYLQYRLVIQYQYDVLLFQDEPDRAVNRSFRHDGRAGYGRTRTTQRARHHQTVGI